MRAMLLERLGDITEDSQPLVMRDLPQPVAEARQVLIRVAACGVCHTELDEIEGRLPPAQLPIILGHEIVGEIVEVGPGVAPQRVGCRVGVGWIHHSSGGPAENIDDAFRATGRDVHGGYAEYTLARDDYTVEIPDTFADAEAAPLLCAGAIGYRALSLTGIQDGEPLGLTGFGGSAHLVLQLARHLFPSSWIGVFARDKQSRHFARDLGADWAGDTQEACPRKLRAIIDTTPAWKPVVEALANLQPGGRLVINAIRKEEADKSELLRLSYHDHLWQEKEIKSVANITIRDIQQFLPIAAEIPIRPTIQTYPLADANAALCDLKLRAVRGAKVLTMER